MTYEFDLVEGRVSIDDLDGFLHELDRIDGVVQGFDARYVVSPRHLRDATEKALRAFERGENVARDLDVEILLYAAGTRQIDVATRIGLKQGEHEAVFVAEPGVTEGVREMVDELEVEYGDTDAIVDFFGITDAELDAVGRDKLELLVLERVALLDIDK